MNELDLFTAAIAIPAMEERRALLDRECAGNDELRQRLERLVAAHFEANLLLDQQAVVTVDRGRLELVGEMIAGRYKLLEEIGEGGMGTVWVAEQTEPVRRKVALKLIKAGLDSKSVLARFEAERQALAVMDHPNIAKVLDGGLTDTGRPYFVMEYVKGVPITEYCDATRLSVPERLNLFVQVCQAVQHAHQKGIIHRDLKPSNILVAPYDDKPVPKVIDFGLAKAMHQSLTERTLHTAHETVLGTPLYMSPEQAQLNNLDVDTRSDIYSLGVLLYELLTGTTPLEKQRFKEAAWDEVKRIIREEEPPRPSMRISSTMTLPSLAAGRQIEPAKLTKLVRGELDWIVMKSLEKDRSRRYETASGFAADVQRYLAGEPVLAAPPSASYRLRKFVRRNRGQVIAASLVLFALLAGIAGTSVGLFEAKKQERLAVAAQHAEAERAGGERLAKLEAQANEKLAGERLVQVEAERKKADAAKAEAQAKEAEANAVVAFFEGTVFAAARPKGQDGGLGAGVTLRDAIVASLPVLDKVFAAQPLVEARLRTALGNTFRNLAEYEQARTQDERARALYNRYFGPDHPVTLGSMNNLANSLGALNRPADALKLREEVLAIQKRVLPPDHPATLVSMGNLANSYNVLNRHADAIKLYEETLAIQKRVHFPGHPATLKSMNNLAVSYAAVNRQADALKLREEVLAIQKQVLPKDHPDTLMSMHNLANSYGALNRHADALKLREETLAIQKHVLPQDHPATLLSMNNLADSYACLNRHADAIKLHKETLEIRKRVLPHDHPDTLLSMLNLAISLIQLDRGAEALPLLDEFLAKAPASPALDPRQISRAFSFRIRHFKKTGDAAGCRTTAEICEKLNRTDANSLYDAACYRAVAAGIQAKTPGADSAKLAKDDADRAMQLLPKAVQAGFKDAALMKKDTDLDFLRDREDFKKLFAELETRDSAAPQESK